MRWKSVRKPRLSIGQEKIISRFLFLPKKLNGEWRWLEVSKIKRQVVIPDGVFLKTLVWEDMEWVD